MNRREAFAFLASAALVAKTTATFPSEKELLFLAAGLGFCEGTFNRESPEADEIYAICPSMVERGWTGEKKHRALEDDKARREVRQSRESAQRG